MWKNNLVIWVLTDDRAGNNAQTIGVAEKLDLPYMRMDIRYNKFAHLPNILLGKSIMGVDLVHSSRLVPPYPDIVISAGRKLAVVAKYIKKTAKQQENKDVRLVHLMWPGYPYQDFDLLAIPKHDGKKERSNMVTITGSAHKFTSEFFEKEKAKWATKFAEYKVPKIALMVGGSCKFGDFTVTHAQDLAEKINDFVARFGGSLLVTTSRRTEEHVALSLNQHLKQPHYYYDWKSPEENPYSGLLASCDYIIVTGDSIAMCSEAIATKKPVYIYSPDEVSSKKHKKFHEELFQAGLAKPFDFGAEDFAPKGEIEDAATKIVGKIRSSFPELFLKVAS